jgi:hypothetical protein
MGVSLALMATTLSSCNLDTTPTTSLDSDAAFKTINNCNNIIANIDKASGSDTDKSRIKGQAYATRGYMYMMLASHFAFSVEKDPHRLQ